MGEVARGQVEAAQALQGDEFAEGCPNVRQVSAAALQIEGLQAGHSCKRPHASVRDGLAECQVQRPEALGLAECHQCVIIHLIPTRESVSPCIYETLISSVPVGWLVYQTVLTDVEWQCHQSDVCRLIARGNSLNPCQASFKPEGEHLQPA